MRILIALTRTDTTASSRDDYVKGLQKIKEHFDFSNLPSSHPLHSTENR